jgi:hypothetical protein
MKNEIIVHLVMHEQKSNEILVKNISSNSDRHLSLNQHNHPREQKDSEFVHLSSHGTHHVRPQVYASQRNHTSNKTFAASKPWSYFYPRTRNTSQMLPLKKERKNRNITTHTELQP